MVNKARSIQNTWKAFSHTKILAIEMCDSIKDGISHHGLVFLELPTQLKIGYLDQNQPELFWFTEFSS